MKLCSFLAAMLALCVGSVANAAIISYDISVTVTADPTSPGTFPTNPWGFGPLPATFVGTFDADDTVAGAISNLNLTIGGLNIATSHPIIINNVFNPGSLVLHFASLDPTSLESAVLFGNPIGAGSPNNYAVAVQNTTFAPLDSFIFNTQNWVGTYEIQPSSTVPEPATLVIWGLGMLGTAVAARRRKAIA